MSSGRTRLDEWWGWLKVRGQTRGRLVLSLIQPPFVPSHPTPPSSSSPSNLWHERSALCSAGWPLVMRRKVSGRPGSALSASPGNTNSVGTKAHRNSCKTSVLCASFCSDAHSSFHFRRKKRQIRSLFRWWSNFTKSIFEDLLLESWFHDLQIDLYS